MAVVQTTEDTPTPGLILRRDSFVPRERRISTAEAEEKLHRRAGTMVSKPSAGPQYAFLTLAVILAIDSLSAKTKRSILKAILWYPKSIVNWLRSISLPAGLKKSGEAALGTIMLFCFLIKGCLICLSHPVELSKLVWRLLGFTFGWRRGCPFVDYGRRR